MYKVIKRFKDLQDNNYVYNAGDIFPREGVVVPESRIEELSTNKNRRGISLIKEISEPKKEIGEPVEETIPEEIEEAIPEEVSKEVVSEPEEDTEDAQTGKSPSKKTKAKKNAKKAQE